jgi:hypothetical protein
LAKGREPEIPWLPVQHSCIPVLLAILGASPFHPTQPIIRGQHRALIGVEWRLVVALAGGGERAEDALDVIAGQAAEQEVGGVELGAELAALVGLPPVNAWSRPAASATVLSRPAMDGLVGLVDQVVLQHQARRGGGAWPA